jgi:hypothetical protein
VISAILARASEAGPAAQARADDAERQRINVIRSRWGDARPAIEPFWAGAALSSGLDQGTNMSQHMGLRITAEGRLFGLDSGDWIVLVGGFALVALVVLLI